MSKFTEAQDWIDGNYPLQHYGRGMKLSGVLNAIRDALTQAEETRWQPASEWHEDDGDCLFLFLDEHGNFEQALFSSPLCSDYPDGREENVWFKKIDFPSFPLEPEQQGAENV